MDTQNGLITIEGADRMGALMDRVLTSDPTMDRMLRKVIKQATREARNRVSRDVAAYLPDDPRKASRAIRNYVYKRIFGSNINILAKRRASSTRAMLIRPRKLDQNPHQRGGNRMKQSDRTRKLNSYFGSDRGFILRFLSLGTTTRTSRYGNRGRIPSNGMFGRIAPWHMEQAVSEIADEIIAYINTLE